MIPPTQRRSFPERPPTRRLSESATAVASKRAHSRALPPPLDRADRSPPHSAPSWCGKVRRSIRIGGAATK
jgi:hypothetical protein